MYNSFRKNNMLKICKREDKVLTGTPVMVQKTLLLLYPRTVYRPLYESAIVVTITSFRNMLFEMTTQFTAVMTKDHPTHTEIRTRETILEFRNTPLNRNHFPVPTYTKNYST